MASDQDILERTISRLRMLPTAQLELVNAFIEQVVSEPDVHDLTSEELAILEPELEGARAGQFANPDEVERALFRPWK
jgi:hypothetical protein